MKSVTLTELKNNFSRLMDLVKKGKTALLVFERDTPVIKVVYAGGGESSDDRHDVIATRLERAGLLRRSERAGLSLEEIRNLRVKPKRRGVDLVATVISGRLEDR